MLKRKSCVKGFTLIELLVVVLIIGILASIAVPQYQKAVDKSKYTQAMVLMDTIYKAQDVYFLANGQYTFHWDELGADVPPPVSTTLNSEAETYRYSWGSCYLHNTKYGVCYVKLKNGESAGYKMHWGHKHTSQHLTQCWAKPTNSNRANAVCQNVTNKSTGYVNSGGGFMAYSFD
ncbi:MAG: prepilin-type N-terminal cleavage/methylation domain-containing protein [Elusimicrobiaceae bacterium]|nr:prepilin-type N-terminal cleavage/methylation domain-containing protein [Elusimicrobiaceae bacterium]